MIPCPLSASSSANDLLQRVCKTGRKFLSLCHLTYIFLCSHFFLLFSSAQTLQYLSIDFHIKAKLLATANIPSVWSGICLPLHFHWCDSYFYAHAPLRLMLSFPEIIVQFHIYLWYIFFLCVEHSSSAIFASLIPNCFSNLSQFVRELALPLKMVLGVPFICIYSILLC